MTVSSAPGIDSDALLAILSSSESVAARINEFKANKAQADAAYEKLRIGTEAKAAFDSAAKLQLQAQALLDRASIDSDAALSTLGEANRKATEAVDGANAERIKILAERDRVAAEVAAQKAAHESWMASTTADLEGKAKDLAVAQAATEQAREDHAEAQSAAETAQAAAAAAALRSAQAEDDFKANAARLQEIVGALPSKADAA